MTNSTHKQAQLLVEKLVRKYKRESVEHGGSKTVSGTVLVNIGGTEHEYDYSAVVNLTIERWREKHPYGSDTAEEEQAEVHVEDVRITEVKPLDGGPEDSDIVTQAIVRDAEERATES